MDSYGMLRLALGQLPNEPATQEAQAQCDRAGKLLALLDSEEPPEPIFAAAGQALAFGHRFAGRVIWGWLREQVKG